MRRQCDILPRFQWSNMEGSAHLLRSSLVERGIAGRLASRETVHSGCRTQTPLQGSHQMAFNFFNKGRLERSKHLGDRLPPGQYQTEKWPVLHYGSVPKFDPAKWDFKVSGLVDNPIQLTYDQFKALPIVTVKRDIHCVTRWSMFDSDWTGVPFREILKLVQPRPEAKFVMALAENKFTANVPLADLDR